VVQMKYSDLNLNQFINALARLAGRPLPVKSAYNVKKWADLVMSARKKISEEYQNEILGQYAEKDEKGAIKLKEPGNPGSYTIPSAELDAFNKATEEFGARTFKLERRKIILEELGNIEISASELTALEPIVTTLEEESMGREHLKAVPEAVAP
jgi:hypothetical protein